MDLYPYQQDGRDFLARNPRAMLADEPGLGKTAQALTAAGAVGAKDIIVICPKSAVRNWHREVRRWLGKTSGRFMVLNFDKFSRTDVPASVTRALSSDWDVLIVDEAHRLANIDANRTQAIYGKLAPRAKRVWALTGTPVRNHNGELWPHLCALRPDLIPSGVRTKEDFEDRFCDVKDSLTRGRVIKGSRNTGILRQLAAPMFLRRFKKDVQTELPDMRFDEYPLPEFTAQEDSRGTLEEWVRDTSPEAIEALLSSRDHPGSLAAARRLSGLDKVLPSAVVIEDFLDDNPGEKALVFAWHRDVLDVLDRSLQRFAPVRIDGGTSEKARDAAVESFQNEEKTRLFLGQIAACGEAITLTAASTVFFVESSWTPADNYQAASRAHRIGQRKTVQVWFLSRDNTVDAIVNRVLARKTRDIADLFG